MTLSLQARGKEAATQIHVSPPNLTGSHRSLMLETNDCHVILCMRQQEDVQQEDVSTELPR